MIFSGSNKDVVEFVKDLLNNSEVSLRSITIMPRDKYEGCCVHIAIDGLSDDIVEKMAQHYYLTHTTIY